jgi:hypothetical protein
MEKSLLHWYMFRIMRIVASFTTVLLLLVIAQSAFSQDPMPVLRSNWEFTTQKADKIAVPSTGPAKLMTNDDRVIARSSREYQTLHPSQDDPNAQTPDARRSVMDKNEQDAKVVQPGNVRGVLYTARVRNDDNGVAKVVYWEYRFTDVGDPNKVWRRQFLCPVNLKKGGEIDLSAFSTVGPADTISVTSLAKPVDKLFDEKVFVNRIEYADGSVLQRGNWKLADIKAAVDRATATPWGKEICRAL